MHNENHLRSETLLTLFEGDKTAVDMWLTLSVRSLNRQTPISLTGNEPGMLRIRRLVGQLEHGIFPWA
jgi:uncharacterized protein (DUF2384 family)